MSDTTDTDFDPDRRRGLYPKYLVFRLPDPDTTPDADLAAMQVEDPVFVLRYTRDPHARAALAAYADSCAADYPQLAADLRAQLERTRFP